MRGREGERGEEERGRGREGERKRGGDGEGEKAITELLNI